MFYQRAIVTLTLGPLFLYAVFLGGWFYFVPITALITLAVMEYGAIAEKLGFAAPMWLLVPAVWLQMLTVQLSADSIDYRWSSMALYGCLLVGLCYALWLYEKNKSSSASTQYLTLAGAIVLFGWLGGHFIRLRGMGPLIGDTAAWQWTFLTFIAAWSADTFAYLVGVFVAGKLTKTRHQLTPRLSPNKSYEGYFGGIILGTILTLIFGVLLFKLPFYIVFLLGFSLTVMSTAGDLGISLLKRESGVKDSGKLLPGHGGALDRSDSLIWAIPFAYYLLTLLLTT